jgi:hypothetical protein
MVTARGMALDAGDFKESDHPRKTDGKFGKGGGAGSGGGAPVKRKKTSTQPGGKSSASAKAAFQSLPDHKKAEVRNDLSTSMSALKALPDKKPSTPAERSALRKAVSPLIRVAATLGGAGAGLLAGPIKGAWEGITAPGIMLTLLTSGNLNAILGTLGAVRGVVTGPFEGAKAGWNWAKKRGDSKPPVIKAIGRGDGGPGSGPQKGGGSSEPYGPTRRYKDRPLQPKKQPTTAKELWKSLDGSQRRDYKSFSDFQEKEASAIKKLLG